MTPSLSAFLAHHHYDPEDLEIPREHGITPLMRAALDGSLELVEELLERGAALDTRNADGNTALWLACVSGRAEIVRALHTAGADLDNQNEIGATALMYTASSGKADLLALLLALGADPLRETLDGAKAGDMAATVQCLKLLRHTVT